MTTTSNQKEIAIQCLEKLDIYKPYIRKFSSKTGVPCFFENFGGFYADQEPELWDKIKEVEAAYNCIVYAITHEFIDGDEMWSMLCVTPDTEIEDCLMEYDNNCFYAFAYVWNKSNEIFSELGDIYIKSFGGGIKRIY
jgi:hypothetical protein